MTVNNQIAVGTLMNLADNPNRASIGQKWRESDVTHRVPIIVTGNDFSTLYAPLIRDGRMEKFYWYVVLSGAVLYNDGSPTETSGLEYFSFHLALCIIRCLLAFLALTFYTV